MDGNRIYKGYWWLPSAPDNQVAGTLNVEEDGDLHLELYGCLGQEGNRFDFERESDKVIYGRCYAPNGHMKDISLFECHSAIRMNFSSSFPITLYSCQYALIGFHTLSMKEHVFYEAHVSFDELAYWCPPKIIMTCYNESALTITFDYSDDNAILDEIEMENGLILRLKQGGSFQPDYPKVFIEQSTYLDILKEELSGLDILEISRMFGSFLSLAMLYPVEHGIVTLFSRDCFQTTESGRRYYHPIELVTHLYKSMSKKKIVQPDLLFKHEDVEDAFPQMYKRFCTDKSIALIWSNLIDSLEKKRVFTSNDFLVVVQALDGFSIRYRKEGKFLSQLTSLREEFNDIKKLKLTSDDLMVARGSRDYYTHILKLENKEKKNALDGVQLLNLTKKLRVLLICCMLKFLGMDTAKINSLLNRCNNAILDAR